MKILAVDDEKGILDFLKKSLEGEGFTVDCAEDGERGLFLTMTNNYDLIILDNMLPLKNGEEVCSSIRKEGNSTPIIMLSAKADSSVKADLLNIGADDYIAKPFSFNELLARIKAVSRRPVAIVRGILRIRNLTLNPDSKVVKIGSKELYLTRKEFSLLEFFLRNKSRVLSRGIIMEQVWDNDSDPFSNTIEMHVLYLRKKLAENGIKDLIKTVPARGYKIE